MKAYPDQKPATHGTDEVQAHLENIGRKQNLKDWQRYQIIDAIQNLFELIEVDWLKQVEWGFCKNSARSLCRIIQRLLAICRQPKAN